MRNSLNTNLRCRQRPWITRWRSCELWTSTPRAPWHLTWWRCRWKSWTWKTLRWGGVGVTANHVLSWCFILICVVIFIQEKLNPNLELWKLFVVSLYYFFYKFWSWCVFQGAFVFLCHPAVPSQCFCLLGGVGADAAASQIQRAAARADQ